MRKDHIPDVMATGYFSEYRLSRILVDEEKGTSYSIQYACDSLDQLREYQEKHAPRLQREHTQRFENHLVAFRTLLEVIE